MLGPRPGRGREPRTKRWVILFVCLLIGLSSFWGVRFEFARSAYQLVALPVRVPLLFIRSSLTSVRSSFTSRQQLEKENKQLKEQLRKANLQLDDLTEVKRQNERLAKLLEFKMRVKQSELTVAEVIGRDPNPMRFTLLINKGSSSGIGRDDPVIVPDGVVGRVIEVYRYSARVLLLQDKQSSIGAMIQRSRAMGDALGQGEEMLTLRNVPPELPVKKGDLVITSGMSTFYPKGLRIGTVAKQKHNPNLLHLEIKVQLNADTQRCEEVLVLKRLKPTAQFAANE